MGVYILYIFILGLLSVQESINQIGQVGEKRAVYLTVATTAAWRLSSKLSFCFARDERLPVSYVASSLLSDAPHSSTSALSGFSPFSPFFFTTSSITYKFLAVAFSNLYIYGRLF